MASARNTIIKDLRAEIADLKDQSLAEDMFERFEKETELTMADKQKLTQELQIKVNELKQSEYDAAVERGDKSAADLAIAPESFKDAKGNVIPPKKLESPKKIMERERDQKPICVPEGCEAKEITLKELKVMEAKDLALPARERKLVGVRMIKRESRYLPIERCIAILKTAVFSFFLMLGAVSPLMAAVAADDKAVVGDTWRVTTDGDLVPKTTNTYGVGNATDYPDRICLGGECKTSWGSVTSPMTDATDYSYPTDSAGTIKLYDAGYISLGGNTAVDSYVLFDSDTDDYYIGHDDTDNDLKIGVGSAVGTDARITIADDANNTIVTIGDDTNAYDHYLVFNGNAADAYLGYLDTYDMLAAGYGSTMDADMAFGVEAGSSPKLVVWNGIDGYGAVDIDYGSADITDHTFTSDGGTLILDGAITLTDSEVLSNPADDTVRVASNDSDTILQVYTPNDTAGDATLQLAADLGDAAGETWGVTADGTSTDLLITNDDALQGTQATVLTISDPGIVTTTNVVNVAYNSSLTSTVQDMLNIKHTTSDTAAANLGAGLTFSLEDASGNLDEAASIDAVQTTATHGATQASDIVVSQNTVGSVAETARFVGASSATTGTYLKILQQTTETDAVLDGLVLTNNTGTAAAGAGIGISFQPEDAGGAEEQASIDVVMTTATDASEESDFVFKQQVGGAITERVRFDSNGPNILLSGAAPYITIGDAGEEDTKVIFDGNAQDFHAGLDDTDDAFKIGIGTALGTTDYLTIASADGDITTAGDIEIIDDMDLVLGTGADWKVQYDEGVDDQLLFITANTAAIATTDPMVEFLVGATPTADQQVFGVAKGTQASNTALLTVDEDGDVVTAGDVTFNSTLLANGRAGGASTVSSSSTNLAPSNLPYAVILKRVGGGGGLDSDGVGTVLPDGVKGQVLSVYITALESGGSWVVTNTRTLQWSKITFDTIGDSATFQFMDSDQGWIILNQSGCTVVYQQIP